MTSTLSEQSSTLYNQDYYLWLEHTAKLLRDGNFSELDIPNLLDEIESMTRSEKRAIKSNLTVILAHLLKYKYQPEKRSNSWLLTIFEHRDRLSEEFADSPSLKPYLLEVFAECYGKARKRAAIETGLPIVIFTAKSPFSPEEALNIDYLPT